MTMGTFNAKISAEFTPPKTWKLEKELSFKTHLLTKEDIELLKMMGTNELYFTCTFSLHLHLHLQFAAVPSVFARTFSFCLHFQFAPAPCP